MSIKQLPQDAIDKIKSTVVITSLNGVISSLVRNSLDASATKIHIAFDYTKGNCSVEDNGLGILPAEFENKGGLGKLHHTTKYPASSATHGHRGDFLAALAGLSLLQVSSKHINHGSHNALLFHNGRLLSRSCPMPNDQGITVFEHGTRVTVRDLFGSLPVRVKQRAVASVDTAVQGKMWSELVQHITALLLAWPSEVTILLRDSASKHEQRLQAPKTANPTARTSALLMQAGLAASDDSHSWVPVASSSRQASVSGSFCLHPAPSRRSQFLSIGLQPLENNHGPNILYEEVNKIFRGSSFCFPEEVASAPQYEPIINDGQRRRSPVKHPMFYLRIEILASGEHMFSEDSIYSGDSQLLEVILELLRAVSYGFLKSHHFRPGRVAKTPAGTPNSTTQKLVVSSQRSETGHDTRNRKATVPYSFQRPSRTSSPFDGWNRVKIGVASGLNMEAPKAMSFSKQRLVGADGTVLRRPFLESEQVPLNSLAFEQETSTGNESGRHDDQKAQLRPGTDEVGANSVLPAPRSEWLAEVVRDWKNPTFETAQAAVPMTYTDIPCAPSQQSHHWGGGSESTTILGSASVGIKRRIHKSVLCNAEVVAQVDKKFILLKLPLSDTTGSNGQAMTALVMLDQHAVDERCQLEDLMAAYFHLDDAGGYIANNELLETPIAIEVTHQESELLKQYCEHFRRWGLHYDVQARMAKQIEANCGEKLIVKSLPPSIIERCRTEPKLLIDLVRHEIWRLHDSGGMPSRHRGTVDPASDHPWVGLFRGCPRGILDLLHSRSCRSAIMFNDSLSRGECIRLITRLSRCAFPFQCAHGRPSMAPVLDLGTEPWSDAWTEEEPVDARRTKWKEWMET